MILAKKTNQNKTIKELTRHLFINSKKKCVFLHKRLYFKAMIYDMIVIGGGAAGVFAACAAKDLNPKANVLILERTSQVLSKVKISGGGRCNVTHACFDPKDLIKHYPRGHKELLGPFHQFSPNDTLKWFAKRGVEIKKEADGRMFPITDSSQTIIDCLLKECNALGVTIRYKQKINALTRQDCLFSITLEDNSCLTSKTVVLATGSSPQGHQYAQGLGHQITPLAPSLFTFNVPNFILKDLSGISVENAQVSIKNTLISQQGPLLIAHFGFTGPAAIKLSAWSARYLAEHQYKHPILINWIPQHSPPEIKQQLLEKKLSLKGKQISSESSFKLPKQLWKKLCELCLKDPQKKWADLSNHELEQLTVALTAQEFQMDGKSTNKEEFVTCGGIDLKEVLFKTMESKVCKGLFFAGEILDIDGVTGGFNFQNAWTGGYIAGTSACQDYFKSAVENCLC